MQSKILISTGGTGGHVYPALALAQELKERFDVDILFVGNNLSKNPYFSQNKQLFKEVEAASFSLKKAPYFFYKTIKGILKSFKILSKYRPDLVIGFGSYHTFPMLVAALLTRQKVYLHEQNRQMGKVNRLLMPFVKKVMITFSDTFPLNKKKSYLVTMPIRFSKKPLCPKIEIRKKLDLKPHLKTVLVTGGSQGALSVNRYFLDSLEHLDPLLFQVIHLVGKNEDLEAVKERYSAKKITAYVKSFDPNMDQLMGASDLVVSRAGAASLCEIASQELPSIMIPYPYANNHQAHNASYMEEIIKGGVSLPEKVLTSALLAKVLVSFFNDENIQEYRHHIKTYNQSKKNQSFANLIAQDLNLYEQR